MFNSAAIEVVIGLVFIYILYSLLVTIITELIATIINKRGKILRKGIQRMLDDEPKNDTKNSYKKKIGDFFKKAKDVIMRKKAPEENTEPQPLSVQFFKSAEIKYLSKKNRIPSYINPSTFSRSVVNLLKKKK